MSDNNRDFGNKAMVMANPSYKNLATSYTFGKNTAPIASTEVIGLNVVPSFGGIASYNALQMHRGAWNGPYAQLDDYPKPNWHFVTRTCGDHVAGGSN